VGRRARRGVRGGGGEARRGESDPSKPGVASARGAHHCPPANEKPSVAPTMCVPMSCR
jgi:hypothetical protein